MDIIFLDGLVVETVIGVYPLERNIKQKVIFDLEMAWDIRRAAETDDIAHALDYKAVSDRVIEFVAASEYFLVETLIENLAKILLQEFSIPWVKITLNKKGAIPEAGGVGISIERGQRP